MKNVLLVLGILLILAGGYAIYSGAGIIEVERGWASVIAGATALTGGIVTIGLSFILGALEGLRGALAKGEVLPAGFQPTRQPVEVPELPVAPAAAPIQETFAKDDAFEMPARKPEPAKRPEPRPAAPAPQPAVASSAAPRPRPANPPASRASSAFVKAVAQASAEKRSEPSISDLWRRVGVNIDTPKPDQGAERPAPFRSPKSPEPERPAPEPADWLDEALAKFDAELSPQAGATEEAPPPLAPNALPEHGEPQSEIIGRYEAEGTAYIMYADGSIEAQSEEGILRFQSMAELKAFFEG